MKDKAFTHFSIKPNAIGIFIAVSVLAVGLFNEYLSCIASAFLCGYMIYCSQKNKYITLKLNIASIAVISITFFYLLSCFWAIDSGMTFIGFVKFLPLPLFMLAVMQQKEKAESYLDILPTASVIMTVISGIVMLFSPRNEFFAPAGRLSGFLQYSNTFALLLLMSLIITVAKIELTKLDYGYIPILIAGIILSGSRTVFILTVLSVIILMFTGKNKIAKIVLVSATAASIAAALIYATATGNIENVGRFLSTSFSESTFIGRLLYYQDAIPVVLQNPFGTGYLGFYYLQQSIQTGLYSVRYVHNDFLQLALDIGWIPTVLLIIAVFKAFFNKEATLTKRLLLFVISAHSFFDIDLQFVAIFMIYLLLLDIDSGKEYKLTTSFSINSVFVLAGSLAIYMSIPLSSATFNNYKLAKSFYPWNTDVNTAIMVSENDASKMDKEADAILDQNKYVTVAYSAKAAYAFSKGDFASVIKYKDMAIANAPLVGEEYENYIQLLLIGEEMYLKTGDTGSAEICYKKIRSVLNSFNKIRDRLSAFGKMIKDHPKIELSEELLLYLNERGIT